MKYYIVQVKTVVTETYKVRANSKEEAMNIALEDCGNDNIELLKDSEGDRECDYNDIYEIIEL